MGVLTNISLFSGAGGLDLGAKLVGGFRTVCYVEWDRYAQAVLMSRMRDGGLDEAPLWDDVSSFDGKPWRGRVDVVSGGFPCQDVSVCRRIGIGGSRSGLWKEFARIVGEVGPRFVLVENVPGLLMDGGLGVVLGDLADLGFDARWHVLSAGAVGAPHLRERVWIIAYPRGESGAKAHKKIGPVGKEWGAWDNAVRCHWRQISSPDWKMDPSLVSGTIDGVARRMDRAKLCGNGVVPQQSAPAWQMIKDMALSEVTNK